MKKEFIAIRHKETTARVQASQIDAVRVKDIVKKGVRVYEGGKIGISGAIGNTAESILLENAVQNLSTGIDYPYPLSQDKPDHRNYNEEPMSSQELLAHAESVLATLREEYPDFSFSEFISTTELNYQMRNSEGLDLEYKDAYFTLNLILKEKKTANLFDGAVVCESRRFDPERFWTFNRAFLEAYRNKVELPEGEILPIFTLGTDTLLGFLTRSLNGERYATGSSIFSSKIGQQLFSDRVTLELNRDPRNYFHPFFDMEGVVLPQDCIPLIEKGKLARVLTDKKTAHLYNLEHTGAATGEYDDLPSIDGSRYASLPLTFRTDARDIPVALQGKPAIFAFVSSGGDFTPDGSFAAPVQIGFLFDGERIIGKLPEFTMRSHLSKMLGEDYIGTFDNNAFYLGDIPSQLQGYYMTIMR